MMANGKKNSKNFVSLITLLIIVTALGVAKFFSDQHGLPKVRLFDSPATPAADEFQDNRESSDSANTSTSGDPNDLETQTYTAPEFERLTQRFLDEVPSIDEVRKQPKHAPHRGMIQAYARTGEIAEVGIRQEDHRASAMDTLETCVNLKAYPTSLRALCLKEHRRLRAATGDTTFDEKNRFPDQRPLNTLIQRAFEN